MVYTEQGIAAAERAWDAEYYRKLGICQKNHAPQTPGALACFGAYYAANEVVDVVVEESVRLLRDYWTRRAAGHSPSINSMFRHLGKLVDSIPNEARKYFLRVKGL